MRRTLLATLGLFIGAQLSAQHMPVDWQVDEVKPGEDIALYRENDFVKEGNHSCKMVLLSDDVPYLLSSPFNVNAGMEYTFTFWYLDKDTTGTLKVYADFFDAQGGVVFGEGPVETMEGEDWQSISWTSTVPPAAAKGMVLVKFFRNAGFSQQAVVHVDDVRFEVSGTNLVPNGGFESWDNVSIPERHDRPILTAAPNPFKDHITFSGVAIDQIMVFNAVGQRVCDRPVRSGETINLAHLAPGLYVVRAFWRHEDRGSARLVRQ